MTKPEAEALFRKDWGVLIEFWEGGIPNWAARCRKWVEFTGELADDRLISEREFKTWSYPRFCLRGVRKV